MSRMIIKSNIRDVNKFLLTTGFFVIPACLSFPHICHSHTFVIPAALSFPRLCHSRVFVIPASLSFPRKRESRNTKTKPGKFYFFFLSTTKSSPFFFLTIFILSPSLKSPSNHFAVKGSSTKFCIALLMGLAPYIGS